MRQDFKEQLPYMILYFLVVVPVAYIFFNPISCWIGRKIKSLYDGAVKDSTG